MKVYCAKIISPVNGERLADSSWVRVGEEYVVVSVLTVPGRMPQLRILADDGSPSLWDAEMFITVSSAIPPHWIATIGENGIFELGAPRLLESGFWERYFDHDPAAVAIFEEEKKMMLSGGD